MRINRIKIPSLFLLVLALVLFLSLNGPAAAAGHPDLKPYTRSGWDYPLVPRDTGGATYSSCSVTSTLPGNTNETYFNWCFINDSTITAPASWLRVYLDGENILSYDGALGPGSSRSASNMTILSNITGGRHTLYVKVDADNEVTESDESNNCWAKQFVWSPLALTDDTPIFRVAPPLNLHGCASSAVYNNNDGFRFSVTARPFSVVGILPSNAAADYDIKLWGRDDYTGSDWGFGSGYLEYSRIGNGKSDFFIVNSEHVAPGYYYAGVEN